ncbi:hypothetical protein [Agromyces mangrovi Wang et al. 2018]|uniref:hypothetical protein n=1 Tax=Agromyces mangrovi TaxID=1858653 RepID=UPI002572CBC9|nr:hypothetical protein [Agromyces mangrovi]BDZ65493.1 hypothetical protein GCM10025877_24310 [Agromyces mangrovi]
MYRRVLSTVIIAGLLVTGAAPALAAPGGSSGDPGSTGKSLGTEKGKGNGNGSAGGTGTGTGQAIGKAPAPIVATPETQPAYTLPNWGDGVWGSSKNYETIQTGDLDGDGDAELIGRSSVGIEAWDFDVTIGQWEPIVTSNTLDWSDDAGWDQKHYFETIGTADVDGDGTDELYTRTKDGLLVVRLEPAGALTDASWQPLPATGAFLSANGWDDPSQYSTMQAADIDGDHRVEIFGRGANAIEFIEFENGGWLPQTLEHFTNAEGWDAEQYYSTIQAADLDHDGKAEVLGRGADGIIVWGLEDGPWVEQAASGPFTDAEGWNEVQHFRTIQTADLDGDGSHEVIGRNGSGLYAYGFADAQGKPNGATWTPLRELGAFDNANGWGDASNYLTIQAADVDGDGRDEILGRQNDTMVVYGMQPNWGFWVAEQRVDGPGFTNTLGWNHPRHYTTIQAADVDGVTLNGQPGSAKAPRADLIGRGPHGIQTYRFDAGSGSWTSPSATFPTFTGTAQTIYETISHDLDPQTDDIRSMYDADATDIGNWIKALGKVQRAASWPLATFRQVTGQISDELTWAQAVAIATANRSALISDMTDLKGLDDTAGHLKYDTSSSNSSKVVADALLLSAGIVDAASNLAGPEAQVTLGALDAMVSFATSEGQGSSSTFEGTYVEMKGAVEGWWGDTQTANTNAKEAIVADYGLLSAVGGFYEDDVWMQVAKGDQAYNAATEASARAYSLWVWQVVSPVLPEPCDFGQICAGWIVGECNAGDCLYHHEGYAYTLRVSTCTTASDCPAYEKSAFSQQVAVGQALIENSLLKQLVGDISASCMSGWNPVTCDYGARPVEVMAGLDGWQYYCSAWSAEQEKFLPEAFCENLLLVRHRYGSRG